MPTSNDSDVVKLSAIERIELDNLITAFHIKFPLKEQS